MPTAGEEAARRFADTITSGDRPAALAVCHPEIEFESMLGLTGRRYLGHAGINQYFDDVQSAWEDWNVDVERVVEGPDGRVAIIMTMRARGKGSGVALAIRTAHIWTLRDGMLVRNELFRDPERALQELASAGSGGSRAGYELDFEDSFEGDRLDERRWLPYYLPQWSTRERAAARYRVGDGLLRLVIEADQEPWCPDLDGDVRVSSLQTGLFAGPLGSTIGQHRFSPGAVVTEEQPNVRLYTPRYGRFEARLKALDDPRCMVALWMIGYEDEPDRSAEICVCEIFGRDVGPESARVGMGVHPFADPSIVDDFAAEPVAIDAREFHVYAAEWTPEGVDFFVDGERIRSVSQSPDYPMQLMLGIYEFPGDARRGGAYPKEFVVDYVRGYRGDS